MKRGEARSRLEMPEDPDWRLVSTAGEGIEGLHTEPAAPQPLQDGEVRVQVEAAGLNFSDVLISVGAVEMDPMLGDEFCGRITETAPDGSGFEVGDRVVGLGIGTFRPDLVTRAEMVARADSEAPAAALATIPTSFVSAELAFQMSGLGAGDRVLVHTASGGVGLAAIQLIEAAGAEVFATASIAKHGYLRSLGISHVYDSRSTDFGNEILEATGGAGVDVVLNSLTGPGFIEASLSCLAKGGRFVEMGRRDIWSAEEMAACRPDVAYSVLEVDALKRQDPATAGASLRRVMAQLADGGLRPLVHTRWPMAEVRPAMEFMRSARHIGKNVIVMPPLAGGRLRSDRTYLVTGGLGGIGTVVAGWLADRGAGVIVLNGRRAPDPEAEEAIDVLRRQGADVRVELADMTDQGAIDAMLARLDADAPPLAGVIHSVGVLSDGSLGNQTWERFEQVLWPKVLGAWHLHRGNAGPRPGHVRPLLQHNRGCGQLGPGQPRGRQCLPGPAGGIPALPGIAGPVHSLGSLVGTWRGRGAARAHRTAALSVGHRLDQSTAGPEGLRRAGAPGHDRRYGRGGRLADSRRELRRTESIPGGAGLRRLGYGRSR